MEPSVASPAAYFSGVFIRIGWYSSAPAIRIAK